MNAKTSNRCLSIGLLLAVWGCGAGPQGRDFNGEVSTENTTDGIKNGNESDIDCGGGSGAPLCANGKNCVSNCDCASGTCQNFFCLAASCTDGVRNGKETDVDCGGPDCPPCHDGQKCSIPGTAVGDLPNPTLIALGLKPIPAGAQSDCSPYMGCWASTGSPPGTQAYCRQPNTCTNTHFESSLGETATDCGGPCKACASGLTCKVNRDCSSNLCLNGTCAPNTCNDGIKNGNETGVDCGGSCAPCAVGGICGGGTPSLTACAANLKCACSACTPIVNLCKGVICPAPASDCQQESCNAVNGACFSANKPDGTTCSSVVAAGGTVACKSGACTATCPPGTTLLGGVCKLPICTPATCASLNNPCGTVPDNCGGTLDCGACDPASGCHLAPAAPTTACNPSAPGEFGGGDGSSANPFLICSVAQLANVTNHLSSAFALTVDLDLASAGLPPIGININQFTGGFAGQNHQLKNFTYSGSGTNYVGLFSQLGPCSWVENLSMTNVNINDPGGVAVGGLAGYATGSTILKVAVDGQVASQQYVGGLVGYHDSGSTVQGSSAAVAVTGAKEAIGGLVGFNSGSIDRCFATGSVTNGRRVGGLVGMNYFGTISNSYASGDVSGNFPGGLVGTTYYTAISSCHALGKVTGIGAVGGFAGLVKNGASVTDSYSLGDAAATSGGIVGGFVGSNTGSTITRCFSTGNASGANRIGGFAGESRDIGSYHTVMSDDYETGSVSSLGQTCCGESPLNAGGFVGGSWYPTERITNSYSFAPSVTVAGNPNPGFSGGEFCTVCGGDINQNFQNCFYNQSGGTAAATITGISAVADMSSAASFPGFDFTANWKLPAGALSPQLIWQP